MPVIVHFWGISKRSARKDNPTAPVLQNNMRPRPLILPNPYPRKNIHPQQPGDHPSYQNAKVGSQMASRIEQDRSRALNRVIEGKSVSVLVEGGFELEGGEAAADVYDYPEGEEVAGPF